MRIELTRVATLAAIVVIVFLVIQLFQMQAQIAKLESNDQTQHEEIVGLVDVADGQSKILSSSTALIGTVIRNQKALVGLLSKHRRGKVPQRQLAGR